MDELSVARIRAFAVTPPDMPAVRYTGPDKPAKRNLEIVRLTLANGIEGIGSCDMPVEGETPGGVVHRVRDLGERVLGQSAANRTSLTQSLLADAGEGPWKPISIIDCAMWDAFARCEDTPLWQLLGAHQERIEAYASTVAHLEIEDYLDDVRQSAELGYRAIKLHLNTDPDFDLELVQTVANEHPNLRFMADLESSYAFDDAVRLGKALDKLPFDWMEAPMSEFDLDAYEELNKAVSIDILPAGNKLLGIENWTEGLRRKAWSRLRCDVANGGGITAILGAMDLARTNGISVELQSYGFLPTQHANLAVMLGQGGCTWFEHPAHQDGYDYAGYNPVKLDSGGCVSAADGAGMGIDMNWEQIEADAFEVFDSHE